MAVTLTNKNIWEEVDKRAQPLFANFDIQKLRYRVIPKNSSTTREVYIECTQVTILPDGTLVFFGAEGRVLCGITADKYTTFFLVDEDGVPLDSFASAWIE